MKVGQQVRVNESGAIGYIEKIDNKTGIIDVMLDSGHLIEVATDGITIITMVGQLIRAVKSFWKKYIRGIFNRKKP